MSESESWRLDEPVLLRRGTRIDDVEMDITPMIDITFLLLIFFLVCSTADNNEMVDLAPARYGKGVGEKESYIITIGDEGVGSAPVYLANGKVGNSLPPEVEQKKKLIEDAVARARGIEHKENVIIKADRNVAYRDVAEVIEAVSRVEGAKIHLAVLEAD